MTIDPSTVAEVRPFVPRSRSADAGAGHARFDAPPHDEPKPDDEPEPINPTPFRWQDPRAIPRREWLYGYHRIRRFLSATVAPGGVGKSSLVITEALAMVSGKPLLGVPVRHSGRLTTWLWNGEDPEDELHRRVMATCLHFGLTAHETEGLHIDSGRKLPIKIATQQPTGTKIATPLVEDLVRAIQARGIDCLIIDPFVSSHSVSENDNVAIEAVVSAWAGIAERTNTSIELVHHVRKGQSGQGEYTVDDARGASALLNRARSARVLNRMSDKEAETCRVDNRFQHFRVDDGKANLAPMSAHSTWFQLVSVPLGNGDPANMLDDGDHVGVVASWQWPDMMAEVTVAQLRAAQEAVAAARWRENHQAKDWVGVPIAKALGLHPKTDRKRILAILKTWLANGMFVVVEGVDGNHEKRSFVEVGEPASD